MSRLVIVLLGLCAAGADYTATQSDSSSTWHHNDSIFSLEADGPRLILRYIDPRLDPLEEQFSNIKGGTKENEELHDRICEIEKHLGLSRRIAA